MSTRRPQGAMLGKARLAAALAVVATLTVPGVAYAHGFGPRYDLPVPLNLFLVGAAAAVALSFVVLALFVREDGPRDTLDYPRYNLLQHGWLWAILLSRTLHVVIKTVSVALLVLVIATGYLGNQQSLENFSPTFVWIIWWVGLTFVVALLGNVWPLVSPWQAIWEALDGLYRRLSDGEPLSLERPYPQRWGVLPAFGLFFAFAWAENAFFNSGIPFHIATMALVYTLITLTGMAIFGKHQWLQHGEGFSVFYGFLSRFSLTEVRVPGRAVCDRCRSRCGAVEGECLNCLECIERSPELELNLRPFAVGLLGPTRHTAGIVPFIIFILGIVTFDGFKATPVWESIVDQSIPPLAVNVFNNVYVLMSVLNTVGMVLFPALFLAIYVGVSVLMRRLGRGDSTTDFVAWAFVLTLVPIALAYHLSHFLSLLLIQGQRLVPLLSDPFGYGWDLLGTASFQVNIAVVNSQFVWYFSVAAIVLGHIIAVYLAHVVSFRVFPGRRNAIASQYPMLALMVLYTVVSLWIIAQPIVEVGPAA